VSSAGPNDPTPGPGEERTSQFEYLSEQETTRPDGSAGRKRAAAGVAAMAVLALAGAGAYGVMQFMSSGDSAATAVPDHALGYVSLDLDPSGGQKVSAYETLRKFPALREELGLQSDDPRRWLVDAINSSGECALDFEDVDPWLGHKVGFAAIEGKDDPEPFFVIEVTDEDAAQDGVGALAECGGGGEEYGTAMVGDFMVVAPSADLADGIAADAQDSPLADDETFGARMDDAGEQGIVTGYIAPAAVALMLDEAEKSGSGSNGTPGATPEGLGDLGMGVVPPMGGEAELLRDHLDEFEGAALQVRFADEGVEMEVVAAGVKQAEELEAGDTGMADLPGTTAVAYGLALGPEAVEAMEEAVKGRMSDAEYEAEVQRFEQQTGLAFPEDVETLLGDGISLALDGSVDFEALGRAFTTGQLQGVSIPAGLRIVSDDTAAVVEVTDKLTALIPPGLPVSMEVAEGDGAVAVGVDPDYVTQLAEDGDLGDTEAFEEAVPDVEGSVGGFFVDFDADGWLDELVGQQDPETLKNTEPLSSMGVSGSSEGDTLRMLLRLTTD
jgi:hypothetical protein